MKNLLIFLILFFVSSHADKISDKQLEILELMSKDNIQNIDMAYYNLLKSKNQKKAKEFLFTASDNLNKQALYALGIKYLENGKTKKALLPLCKSSILGSAGSARDLYLIPMLLNINKEDIEYACKLASKDINKVLYTKQNSNNSFKSIKEKINMFEYERKSKNLSYLEYLALLSLNMDLLTEEGYTDLVLEIQKESISRVEKNKRLKKEALDKQNANWEKQKFLNRVDNRKNGANDVLSLNRDSDIDLIQNEVYEKLNNFNKLRSSNKKISSEDFWKLVNKNR
ncbi:MAG: hypothetical protein DRG78_03565 [Epsilonproteobacteria bacterium]|nr:MAG: hypothetical protein DRG78_03565 [Campylobacterota bacterium]